MSLETTLRMSSFATNRSLQMMKMYQSQSQSQNYFITLVHTVYS